MPTSVHRRPRVTTWCARWRCRRASSRAMRRNARKRRAHAAHVGQRQSKHGSGAIMCKSASCDNRHAGRRIIAHAALIAHIPIERRPSRRRLARRRARTRQPCSRLSRRQGKWCMVLASLCARSSSPNFTSRCARICTRADTREDMRTVAACTILGGVGTYGSRGSRSGGQEMISSDVLSDIPL